MKNNWCESVHIDMQFSTLFLHSPNLQCMKMFLHENVHEDRNKLGLQYRDQT